MPHSPEPSAHWYLSYPEICLPLHGMILFLSSPSPETPSSCPTFPACGPSRSSYITQGKMANMVALPRSSSRHPSASATLAHLLAKPSLFLPLLPTATTSSKVKRNDDGLHHFGQQILHIPSALLSSSEGPATVHLQLLFSDAPPFCTGPEPLQSNDTTPC